MRSTARFVILGVAVLWPFVPRLAQAQLPDTTTTSAKARLRDPTPADPCCNIVRIDKALALPLPRDTLYRPLVAAYWLDLIGGFLGRAEFELVLLLQEGDQSVAPRLLVGFNGADPRTLHAALDPQVAEDQIIRVADADWVQDELDGDYALNRLASFLGHDDLPLRLARGYFNETFLGT